MNRRDLVKQASLVAVGGMASLASSTATSASPSVGLDLVDRLVKSINSRELSMLDQIYAAGADYTNHQVLVGAPSTSPGRDVFKAYLAQRIVAFPDLNLAYDTIFATVDMVAVNLIWQGTQKGEYLGVPPTSKKVVWNSTDLFRIKSGLFSDHWGAVDLFGLERQLKS